VTQQLIGEGMALLRLDEDGCAHERALQYAATLAAAAPLALQAMKRMLRPDTGRRCSTAR
jgi:hypothetical protein